MTAFGGMGAVGAERDVDCAPAGRPDCAIVAFVAAEWAIVGAGARPVCAVDVLPAPFGGASESACITSLRALPEPSTCNITRVPTESGIVGLTSKNASRVARRTDPLLNTSTTRATSDWPG